MNNLINPLYLSLNMEKKHFISISEAMAKGKGHVAVRGWIYRERGSNAMKFLVLRDSSDIIQCVLQREKFEKQWGNIDKLQVEASVELEGEIKEDKRAPTGYEIQVTRINIVGLSDSFPINKDFSEEFLLDMRHLSIRRQKMINIWKIRSTVFEAIHEYFKSKGYYETQSPIFTPSSCEGGSTVFEVKYFDKKVFLTQSWQLYAEAMVPALEKIYTVAPMFRAEKSKTARHLTECWLAEVETAWMNFDELSKLCEGLISYICGKVARKNSKELEALGRDPKELESVKSPFPKITYDEALKILEKDGLKVSWGKDLRTLEEKQLITHYDKPLIVTHYPKKVKAFYMKEDPNDNQKVLGLDVLAPGIGEILGGSERETDVKIIEKKLRAQGEKMEEYQWYLDVRRYGSVPHSGFGLGIERIIQWICKLDSIKDTIPFPRTIERYKP